MNVKVPMGVLMTERTYVFFSHTIKAQPYNMPLLDALLEKKIRLMDYEAITSTGKRGGPRLVAFGRYAGIAGAIDFTRGIGERFLALGYATPFLHCGSSYMYPSLEKAYRALKDIGADIAKPDGGLPAALC
jgi:alpha-aminoadipic semialdehyde synthase